MTCYYHGNTGCNCSEIPTPKAHYTLNSSDPFIISKKKYEPKQELEVTIASVNGLRVLWNGNSNTYIVKRKDNYGNWYTVGGIQKIDISFSVEDPLPTIIIQEIAIPDKNSSE